MITLWIINTKVACATDKQALCVKFLSLSKNVFSNSFKMKIIPF